MEINRDNYEMFFLLYTDNELDATERKAIEVFLDGHADLKEELDTLMQTRLSDNETLPFLHKESLYKISATPSFINTDNYEEYFVLYGDGELNKGERKAVESFIENHPQKQAELLLLQQLKIQPDHRIVFPWKNLLYRTEKAAARVIAFPWRLMAAAASVIAIGSWLWMNAGNIIPQQAVEQPLATKVVQPAEHQTHQKKGVTTTPVIVKAETEPFSVSGKVEPVGEATKVPVAKAKAPDRSLTAEQMIPSSSIANSHKIKPAETVDHLFALNDETPKLVAHVPPVVETKGIVFNNVPDTKEVKPLILDKAAFLGKSNEVGYEAIARSNEGIAYWDTDHAEKKSKGKFRGLLRRASRLVDHVTNPDIDDKRAVVRVASFEITRK